jgi:hypothetical protein
MRKRLLEKDKEDFFFKESWIKLVGSEYRRFYPTPTNGLVELLRQNPGWNGPKHQVTAPMTVRPMILSVLIK